MSGVQFTTLIRVPFPRGEFVDPQQASWDAAKDRTLWKLISKSSKASDLDWVELAEYFHVPPAFLLQQAAWLYERQLNHVRAQMKKVGGASTTTNFNLDSTHTAIGGIPMKRAGSGGSGASRTPSTLPTRPKDSPVSRGETSTTAPPLSRTPSINTITQSRANAQQTSVRSQPFRYRQRPGSEQADQSARIVPNTEDPRESPDPGSPAALDSSSSSSSPSDSDLDNPAKRSQLFKRPPRFRNARPKELISYDEDIDEADEHEPSADAMLPFANTSGLQKDHSSRKQQRRAIALSKDQAESFPKNALRHDDLKPKSKAHRPISHAEAESSVTSSTSDAPKSNPKSPGPLSPNHRADLAKLSPRRAGLKSKREGSEGTPSMGSSFSDIDDAGISQSALEEALLSNIQHGRMSTLSQLRSRYL